MARRVGEHAGMQKYWEINIAALLEDQVDGHGKTSCMIPMPMRQSDAFDFSKGCTQTLAIVFDRKIYWSGIKQHSVVRVPAPGFDDQSETMIGTAIGRNLIVVPCPHPQVGPFIGEAGRHR